MDDDDDVDEVRGVEDIKDVDEAQNGDEVQGVQESGHEKDIEDENSPSLEPMRPSTSGKSPLDFLEKCPWKIPTTENQISNFDPIQIARDALETTVILHPRFPKLVSAFLDFKREHGSDIERTLYTSMSQHDLIARLIKKRPLMFVNKHDWTVLRDGTELRNGHQHWLRVGTPLEGPYIYLKDYLSYDEMMLSSLIGTSGPSYLINDGHRKNEGKKDSDRPHQKRGIMIGLVGARFAVPGQMDYALCGIRTHRLPFRQDPRLTKIFRDWLLPSRPTPLTFDRPLYRARMRISIEMALLEADDRAAAAGTTAHVFLAGLGLGVWRYHDSQIGLWYREIADCLETIDLAHVTTVEIGWNACPQAEKDVLLRTERNTGIKIIVGSREPPCRKLDTDELLVRVWAWDSNSLPGKHFQID